MELFNDSSGPSVDLGVLARMRRLDANLYLTFSTYGINPETTAPMEIKIGPDFAMYENMDRFHRRGNAWFIYDPSYYLWTKDPEGRWVLVNTYPAVTGFGHREVQKLEADVARTMRPSDIVAAIYEHKERREAKAKADEHQAKDDVFVANKSRMHDLMFEGKTGRRQAKIVSYAGQKNRSTPGDILSDAREDGWELREKPDDK